METKNYLGLIVMLCLVAFVGWHELHRYNECLHDCLEQAEKDYELLQRDVCQSAHDRVKFGGMIDCDGAQRRLRIEPKMCAWHKWRLESQLMHVYSLMTQSYWSILGWSVPLLCFFLFLWSQERREDKWVKVFRQRGDEGHRKRLGYRDRNNDDGKRVLYLE